jgi:hypothetical protein
VVAGPGLKGLRRVVGAATPVIRMVYPSPHIRGAMERLGPGVEPSVARLPGAGVVVQATAGESANK